MTLADGSPLRRLGVTDALRHLPVEAHTGFLLGFDGDGNGLLLAYPAADDCRDFDQAAELADTRNPFMDGHGYRVIKPYLALEYCALCTKPIPLEYATGECELDGGDGCECNACIPRPVPRGGGRFRYCSKRCKDTVNNARRRRRRRRTQAARFSGDKDLSPGNNVADRGGHQLGIPEEPQHIWPGADLFPPVEIRISANSQTEYNDCVTNCPKNAPKRPKWRRGPLMNRGTFFLAHSGSKKIPAN